MGSLLFILSAVFLLGTTVAAENANAEAKCSRPHEILKCVRDCPAERTCKNRDIKYKCPAVNKRCKLECRCEEGYIRSYLGDCVPEKVCDRCPGDHEFYQCGPACDNVCETIATQNRTICPIMNIKCNEKCYCEDGFARDSDNKCIPVNECKSSKEKDCSSEHVCEGPNEEYAECKPTCPPETCLSRLALFNCIPNQPCKPRCVCKSGYLRKSEGEPCMPSEQCPKRGEKSSEEKDCSSEHVCEGPNEEYAECKPTCPPETCISLVAKYNCIQDQPCKPRCVCKSGFLRKSAEEPCIPSKQCPQMANSPDGE